MKTELLTNEFADINVSELPRLFDVDELKVGCFARNFSGSIVREPSLLFIEKIDMHESGGLAVVYWHWINQYNGFELNTWATTFRKQNNIAFEKGYCWASLYNTATCRILDAPRTR